MSESNRSLSKVLFVRATEDLVGRLDRVVEMERVKYPGRSVSRADVVREILHDGVLERLVEQEAP